MAIRHPDHAAISQLERQHGISRITITGLTLLTPYVFEVSITIGEGAPSAWGQAYTILIH